MTTQNFKDIQYAFAKHLRDPDNTPGFEGIEDRRLKIYRELFFGNMKSLVSQTFPVLKKFYTDEQWDQMIRSFMIKHESTTPLFLEVSSEFIEYLQTSHEPTDFDPPFLLELAHYEWVELAVSVMDAEIDESTINDNGNLAEHVPFLSPYISSLVYSFPVHEIKPGYDPSTNSPEATFLLVFRNKLDKVEFMLLNAVSARLIALLQEDTARSGNQLLQQIAEELQHPNPQTVIDGGMDLLKQFKDKDIILGTYNS